jgi:hypothetical protein
VGTHVNIKPEANARLDGNAYASINGFASVRADANAARANAARDPLRDCPYPTHADTCCHFGYHACALTL